MLELIQKILQLPKNGAVIKKVLHLTHSDALNDSRIEKAHETARNINFESLVIGVRPIDGKRKNSSTQHSIGVWSRDFRELLIKFVKALTRRRPKLSALEDHPSSKTAEVNPTYKTPSFVELFFNLAFFVEINIKIFLRSVAYRPAVIHCNDWYVLPAAVAAKKICGAKLLYDAHELESEVSDIKNQTARMVRAIESWAWKSVDLFITVSPSIETWYHERFGEKPSGVILNSPQFEVRVERDSLPGFRDVFLIPESAKIYLYIGYISLGRGIETILDAFLRTKSNSVAIFLGEGEYVNKIENQSQQRANVFVHPMVSHEEVVHLASSADFGLCLIENVSLSDYYCLPNKLFEYAFAGIPVVASEFPEISRVVSKYGLGYCVEPNVENLLEFLDSEEAINPAPLSQDIHRLEELGWKHQQEKLENFYKSLVA
jgi:glycosyltransferase involved in cell wall biosynthesis